MALGAQDRPAVHQSAFVPGRIFFHILSIVQGQDIRLHPSGADPFYAAIMVAVITAHFSGNWSNYLVAGNNVPVRIPGYQIG